jgi:flagellar motor switch protein FliN/FliY
VTIIANRSGLVAEAVSAAIANLPIADPLVPGEPIGRGGSLTFDGTAVTARFTGARSGEVVIAVEQVLVAALRNSPLGPLEITAALAPAVTAAAQATGTVAIGPLQEIAPGLAFDALLAKPNTELVPLLHAGIVRAVVGLSITEPSVATAVQAPQYPTAAELKAAAPATKDDRLSRRGLELLRDVNMEVTAQIGSTRMTINELLNLSDGAVVELDRAAGAPADLLVNGHLIAHGEVVVIDENFALRITEIVSDGADSAPE